MTTRRGFTLLEMLCVFVALAAAMTISILLLTSLLRAGQMARTTGETLTWRAILSERFREDVHATVKTHEHWKQFDSSPTCVILELADGSTVVYDFHDKLLLRHSATGKQVLRLPGAQIPEFIVEPGPITLRLSQPPRPPYDMTIARGAPK